MTIEGLGKKFQEARLARNLTLDEAARMTKIRPSRLAEIEADDFSQFPSLAYAKGFLLIYGKFLDVDVTPYMEAFETSEHVTVDGYSYLQDNPAPKPTRTPVVRHRPSSSSERTSIMPMVIGIIVLIVGFSLMRFVLNLQRIAGNGAKPSPPPQSSVVTSPPASSPVVALPPPAIAQTNRNVATPTAAPASPPVTAAPTVPSVAVVTPPPVPSAPAASEPEVRRAEPVRPEELAKAGAAESTGPNRVAIRPLKKTYIKVVVDNEAVRPAFERWISPADGSVEFRGQHIAVRVLDRDAVQIKKNGKLIDADDSDVTIE
jgi:cytoskeleton protein RodZ